MYSQIFRNIHGGASGFLFRLDHLPCGGPVGRFMTTSLVHGGIQLGAENAIPVVGEGLRVADPGLVATGGDSVVEAVDLRGLESELASFARDGLAHRPIVAHHVHGAIRIRPQNDHVFPVALLHNPVLLYYPRKPVKLPKKDSLTAFLCNKK